ncbi:hypothetical protein LCGC14_1760850 [marine sediment metagenome]|uniref:Uncharacterized protein n=1 Tax=marine sediment metagenome TaxID=412755 RepID=A0A0F9JG47_9ZZZZ
MNSEKTLEELQSAFKTQDGGSNLPNNYYPFWKMDYGHSATIRLLPDLNPDNPMGFLVEKRMHNLGIAGERKSVPCLTMYEEDCPICKVSSSYYKQKNEDLGKKYWRKKQYIAQALILEDPLPLMEGEESRLGTVGFFGFGWSIFSIFKDAIQSGEFDTIPYAFTGGTNFIIKKQKKIGPGGKEYPDYTLSKFARKETDISAEVISLIEDQLVDLSTLLPANPGLAKVEGMLEAEMSGGSVPTDGETVTSVAATASEAARAIETPTTKSAVADAEVDDVLEAIRARKASRSA